MTGLQTHALAVLDLHQTVDFGSIGFRACDGQLAIQGIDQHLLHAADLALQLLGTDIRLQLHETRQTLLLDFFRNGIRQGIGGGAVHRRIGEGANPVELGLVDETQQLLEIVLGLAGKADDEGASDGQVRADIAPFLDALEILVDRARTFHQFQNARTGVLERDVQIRQELAFGHQRDDVVHMRVRVNVVQARPHAQLREACTQVLHAGLVGFVAPLAFGVTHIHAVGAGVL